LFAVIGDATSNYLLNKDLKSKVSRAELCRCGIEMQEAIEKIVNGVAIVTSRSGEKINGLSIAWMSQVGLDPPLVMVAVGKGRTPMS